MSRRAKSYTSLLQWLITLVMAFAMAGCTTVKLIGDYDEQIDKGVTQLQKETETFLVKLENSAREPRDMVEEYAKNSKFYADTKISLSGLRVRADATERNSITVKMLMKVSSTVEKLEKMHKEGLAKAEIEYLRGALNSEFTSILTFELAKKRGEKIDRSKAEAPTTPTVTTEGMNK